MARAVIRRSCRRPVSFLLLLVSSLIVPAASAQTRGTSSVPGVVVDEAGAAVAGARVTASDANGTVVQTTTSDAAGAFSLQGLCRAPTRCWSR